MTIDLLKLESSAIGTIESATYEVTADSSLGLGLGNWRGICFLIWLKNIARKRKKRILMGGIIVFFFGLPVFEECD